jgi:hypothetical protein
MHKANNKKNKQRMVDDKHPDVHNSATTLVFEF